jgi:hypothetical protein
MDRFEVRWGPSWLTLDEELNELHIRFEDPQTRKSSDTNVRFEPEHTVISVGDVVLKVGTSRVQLQVKGETLYNDKPNALRVVPDA